MDRTIRANLEAIRDNIRNAARRAGRSEDGVILVAVTKTFGPEVINAAVSAGQRHLGENRVQEFLEKAPLIEGDVSWHFIGHLQRNKVRKVIGRFDLIHSVDSFELAGEISRRSADEGIVQDILIQVHTAREETKFGVSPAELIDLTGRIGELEGVSVKGLMTVGTFVPDPQDVRTEFQLLRRLRDEVEGAGIGKVSMGHLSMGMSGDYEVAIEEDATLIRIGTAIFGQRAPYGRNPVS